RSAGGRRWVASCPRSSPAAGPLHKTSIEVALGGDVPLSIIIPAFNEEKFLAATLDALRRAEAHLRDAHGREVEVIVVDNASTDRTAEIARDAGANVV